MPGTNSSQVSDNIQNHGGAMSQVNHTFVSPVSHYLKAAGIEPGVLYPLCNEQVVASELYREMSRQDVPIANSMISSMIVSRAIDIFYSKNEEVRFSTCLRRVMVDLSLPHFFDKDTLQKVAEIFGALKARTQLFVEVYVGPVNWTRGDFGNPHSCYWSERPGARYLMESLFHDDVGCAFRIYSKSGNGPIHPDNKDMRGYGRMWGIVWKNYLCLFNPYPGHHMFDTYSAAIGKLLKMGTTRRFEAYNYTENNRPDHDLLYINHEAACALYPEDHDATDINVHWRVNTRAQCSSCGHDNHLNRMRYDWNSNSWECRDCDNRDEEYDDDYIDDDPDDD